MRQVLCPDLSDGKADLGAALFYGVSCDRCAHRAKYGSDGIERYQHPTDSQRVI